MHIQHGLFSRRTPLFQAQVEHMAACLRSLLEAWQRNFPRASDSVGLSLEDFEAFSGLPEYEAFMQVALATGFLCGGYEELAPLEEIHATPSEWIAEMSFDELRLYVHTLQRTEGWFSEFSTALWTSVASGAAAMVVERLTSDASL